MSQSVSSEIDVKVPLKVAYNQWTQFETFPAFLNGVHSVEQLADDRTHWVVSILGVSREFDATITAQVPDERIAWESTDGPLQTGQVEFSSDDPDKNCHVKLTLDWQPSGLVEKAGAALKLDALQVSADLSQFKVFIEKRGQETGAWRGEIEDQSLPEAHPGRVGDNPDLG